MLQCHPLSIMYPSSIELRRKISGAMKRSAPTRIVRTVWQHVPVAFFCQQLQQLAMAKALVPKGALPVNKRCLSCLGHKSVGAGLHWFQDKRYEIKTTNTNTLDCLTASLCDKFFLGFRIVSHITQFLLDLGR